MRITTTGGGHVVLAPRPGEVSDTLARVEHAAQLVAQHDALTERLATVTVAGSDGLRPDVAALPSAAQLLEDAAGHEVVTWSPSEARDVARALLVVASVEVVRGADLPTPWVAQLTERLLQAVRRATAELN